MYVSSLSHKIPDISQVSLPFSDPSSISHWAMVASPGAVALHLTGPRSISAAGQRPGSLGRHCTVHWENLHLYVAWLEINGIWRSKNGGTFRCKIQCGLRWDEGFNRKITELESIFQPAMFDYRGVLYHMFDNLTIFWRYIPLHGP